MKQATTNTLVPIYPNYSLGKSEDRVNENYQNKANDNFKFFGVLAGSINSFRIDSSIPRDIQESSKPSSSPNDLLMKKID